MKKSTKRIINIMHVVSWIIFVGICIKTGSVLVSSFVSLFINPEATKNLYLGLNLSSLRDFSMPGYLFMIFMVIAIWILKAIMFYIVIKIFMKINFAQPFSTNMALLIRTISYVALTIGLLAVTASSYMDSLIKKGLSLSTLPEFVSGGADHLFFSGIIFIIYLVFKKGIEIQSENELTV